MSKHYLLSLPIPQIGFTMHCYLMSNDKADIRVATAKLLEVTEEHVKGPYPPMILVTPLGTSGTKTVRDHVARNPEAKKLLKEAADFHITIWAMAGADPVNDRLMALH